MKTEDILAALAKRLRSRAQWCGDPWYDSGDERTKNEAKREVFEEIAEEIEGLLLPEPKEPNDE